MTPKLDVQAVARETADKIESDDGTYGLIYFLTKALTSSYEAGRIAGLEEAIKVCRKESKLWDGGYEESAKACIKAIKTLIKGGGE